VGHFLANSVELSKLAPPLNIQSNFNTTILTIIYINIFTTKVNQLVPKPSQTTIQRLNEFTPLRFRKHTLRQRLSISCRQKRRSLLNYVTAYACKYKSVENTDDECYC